MSKLLYIQQELKAPKGQYNQFGKYKYRNCEDILEALKAPLKETGCHVTLSDKIVMVGDRIYVEATASLYHNEKCLESTTAYAREPIAKKGMDESQITGAASSYARKYALNGLFAIDDTKDADSNDNSQEQTLISKEQLSELSTYCMDVSPEGQELNDLGKRVTAAYKIESLDKLPANVFNNVMNRLKNENNQ